MSTISPPRQPRDQPLVDVGDLRRRTIARHDDLPAARLQRVEQAQQLALRLAPAGEELHVVDQQHVDARIALLERSVVAVARSPRAARSTNSSSVTYSTSSVGLPLRDLVADRAHQVRLAEPRAAVDEQRVVDRARRLGDGARRGDGQPVGRADDEVVEAERAGSTCSATLRAAGRSRRRSGA